MRVGLASRALRHVCGDVGVDMCIHLLGVHVAISAPWADRRADLRADGSTKHLGTHDEHANERRPAPGTDRRPHDERSQRRTHPEAVYQPIGPAYQPANPVPVKQSKHVGPVAQSEHTGAVAQSNRRADFADAPMPGVRPSPVPAVRAGATGWRRKGGVRFGAVRFME